MADSSISYRGCHFPGAVISHAVWLYLRFPLSFRDVEELLAERGIRGCDNISPHMPAAIRKLVTRHRLSGDRFAVQVTGAWRGRKGHSACVDLAAEEFRRRGVPTTIRRSAVRE